MRPDFSGVWQADLTRSILRGAVPKEMLAKIEHREDTIVQTMLVTTSTGDAQRMVFTFSMTGAETTITMAGGTGRTRAHWEGSELVIESALQIAGRELHFRDCWSLSSDGNHLTMAHRDDDLAGQVSVFEKAPPEAAVRFNHR